MIGSLLGICRDNGAARRSHGAPPVRSWISGGSSTSLGEARVGLHPVLALVQALQLLLGRDADAEGELEDEPEESGADEGERADRDHTDGLNGKLRRATAVK